MKKNGHHHHHNTHIFDLHHGIWSFILYLSLLIASHFLHFSLVSLKVFCLQILMSNNFKFFLLQGG